jgi:hypothetical protein
LFIDKTTKRVSAAGIRPLSKWRPGGSRRARCVILFFQRGNGMRGVTLASAGGQMPKSEAAGTMIKAVSGNMGRVTAVTGLCFLLTSTAYLA